jgi:hypothetical protein
MKTLYIRYQWQEVSDADWSLAWPVFWFFHFLLAITTIIYLVVDAQLKSPELMQG